MENILEKHHIIVDKNANKIKEMENNIKSRN